MDVLGHRGAAGLAPENTIEAFRLAVSLGLRGVEFDVRLTGDSRPVVIHDATIDRTTGASGVLRDLTYDELRDRVVDDALRVPDLMEVIEILSEVDLINVELKEPDAAGVAVETLSSAMSAGLIRSEQILFTSFERDAVKTVRQRTDAFQVGLLTRGIPGDDFWDLANSLKVASVNIDLASVDRDFVQRGHRNGMRVMVYTVNSEHEFKRMKSLKVDAIFTDYPDRLGD